MIGSFLDIPKYLAPLDPNDKAEDNFEVLMSKEELQKIAKKICDKLHHSVTIIDANRIDNSENIDVIRTDSNAEYLSMRSSCRLFHYCAGSKMCHKCDNYHAKKFIKYIRENGNCVLDYKDRPNFFYDDYEKNLPSIIEINEDGIERKVYEYHCPILGYRELVFPIYYEGRIFGVLFVLPSVIKGEGDVDFVRRTKKSFFSKKINNPKNIFFDYLKDSQNTSAQKIKKEIINIDRIYMPIEELFKNKGADVESITEERTMTFNDYSEFRNFIKEVCFYLEIIEKDISEIYAERRKSYFIDVSKKIVDDYFQNITDAKEINNKDNNQKRLLELQTAWNKLECATESLSQSFGIKDMFVFGDGPFVNMIGNKKKSLYPETTKMNWYYDFSTFDLTDKRINEFALSFEHSEIKKGLKADLNSDFFIILFSEIAIVFCVDDLDLNYQIYYDMAYKIGSQFIRIHSSIALYAADFMQDKLTLTLRMNRHETSHISTRLKDDIDIYFADDGYIFNNLRPEKRAKVIDDMKNTTRLLSNMAANIGIITGSINEENIKKRIGVTNVHNMLETWQMMFKDRLEQRNLRLRYRKARYGNIGSNCIRTVSELFELVIYNLIDNAVKYAYRGTNIYMYWDKKGDKNIFTIQNFGPKIDNENIYRLYERGETYSAKTVEGDGIGLYATKRISELLNGEISFTCDPISKYNLPLIPFFEKKYKNDSSKYEQIEALKAELGIVNEFLRTEMINNSYTEIKEEDISKRYLNERINNEIYETIFTVIIPDKLKGEGIL